MRGGYLRDHVPPYTGRDLVAEFGDWYDIQPPSGETGGKWTARLLGYPDALPVTADTPGELARTLRMRQ